LPSKYARLRGEDAARCSTNNGSVARKFCDDIIAAPVNGYSWLGKRLINTPVESAINQPIPPLDDAVVDREWQRHRR